MGWFANWLFRISYLPIRHQSVKRDFLNWFYQAASDHRVIEGLDADNPDLIEASQTAAQHANNLDEEHHILKLLDQFEEYTNKLDILYKVGVVVLFLLGSGITRYGVSVNSFAVQAISGIFGASLSTIAVVALALYGLFVYQLRTNAGVVAKFNNELSENPGDIRRNDQYRTRLVAQYFWNQSLCRPVTVNLILLLSIIQLISTKLYGNIAGDLQHNIDEFIGMNGREIAKHQFNRLREGDYYDHSDLADKSSNGRREFQR